MPPVYHRKLVRDKIPEIIREQGGSALVRALSADEFDDAIGRKVLEEAHELFNAWRTGSPQEILRECADVYEILLSILSRHGYSEDELIAERQKRLKERGGFGAMQFLECVGQDAPEDWSFEDSPALILAPTESSRLISLIKSELAQSESAWIASAFYSPGVMNLLTRDFNDFVGNGHSLHVILSTMGNITRPEHLNHLQDVVPGIQLRVYHPQGIPFDRDPPNFHLKIYLFRHRNGSGSLLIGSSNFTEAGLCRNVEWNYFSPGEVNLTFDDRSAHRKALDALEHHWENDCADISAEFLDGYRKRYRPDGFLFRSGHPTEAPTETTEGDFVGIASHSEPFNAALRDQLRPNVAQKEALENLTSLRSCGAGKAAVIAATGVGKTYLAAFDFRKSGYSRVLFIAHRENILQAAMGSFQKVLADPHFGVLLGAGNHDVTVGNSVFAMIQTLSREEHLRGFSPDAFDYMVVDEFHHGEAESYVRVLDYFRPAFLLGLTATPERMDGRDVLQRCDGAIAYELRLLDAVNRGLLTPFQYYAIYDPVDYEEITWRGTHYDLPELEKALENDTRTAILANNLSKYLPAFGKIKALAFCTSVSHALYTAHTLSQDHGITAIALSGDSSDQERAAAIQRLRDESDPLKVICTVDIFNEGIDIPEVTHVLFLRPTQSYTLFLQQLGRGLRLRMGKDYVVVLDFVGNFRRAHIAPIALQGYVSEAQFAEAMKEDCRTVPILPQGCFLDADLEVKRIWDQEIHKIMRGELSTAELLKILYWDIKEDLGMNSPSLLDFIGNSHGVDPQKFIREFGGWLRAKKYCEGELPAAEEGLLDTPGEIFLKHIEMDLNPNKSYKMVVLMALLRMSGTRWKIKEIAERFLDYYLKHPERMYDYEDLAKSEDPKAFKINKVVTKIKNMPLHFLSNTNEDCFILDKNSGVFGLKEAYIEFWTKDFFKEMVKERSVYALQRYFQRTKTEVNEGIR
ncbi:MAG: DEAD/DEAH box helicase family protein [Syntrophobacteraceae bacterium]